MCSIFMDKQIATFEWTSEGKRMMYHNRGWVGATNMVGISISFVDKYAMGYQPLSLFISLLSMPKKAFDNVKI